MHRHRPIVTPGEIKRFCSAGTGSLSRTFLISSWI
jgi:hypothetical protein